MVFWGEEGVGVGGWGGIGCTGGRSFNVGFYSDLFFFISEFFSIALFRITFTFIQGHRGVRKQKVSELNLL